MRGKALSPIQALVISLLFISACSEKNGAFLLSPGVFRSEPYIVIASGDTNHAAVTVYTTSGQYVSRLMDFLDIGGLPRGLAILDPYNLIVSSEYVDTLYNVSIEGVRTPFFVGTAFAGNIYDIAKDSRDNFYAVESNAIEKFDKTGNRLGNPFQNGNLGLCLISAPRNIFVTPDDQLIIANSGGTDNVTILDVSGDTPSCIASVALGNNPYGVLKHSNGFIYVSTQGNDQIYRLNADLTNPTVIWTTNTTLLNDPSAMVEMPDGNIAVAGATNDTIELIDPDGNRVGTAPFIKTPDTLNITDMVIWPGE